MTYTVISIHQKAPLIPGKARHSPERRGYPFVPSRDSGPSRTLRTTSLLVDDFLPRDSRPTGPVKFKR
jgi:hypothetical protein